MRWRSFRNYLLPVILLGFFGETSLAQVGSFEIKSDQKSTVTGADLCIAVDRKRPMVADRGVTVKPKGGAEFAVTGTFYPVVTARCGETNPDLPTTWRPSNTRELRIRIDDKWMCLSARTS